MRYFIRFAYNGGSYHGWQIQPNASSVQETLTKALQMILRAPIEIMGAGRTDTGVHAKEMFAHFDFDGILDAKNTIHRLNAFLPKDIAIFDIFLVNDQAHARFDATIRSYEYHIHFQKNPFSEGLSYYISTPLDVSLMNQAAEILKKHADFQCFSKVNTDVNNFNCNIFEAKWEQTNYGLIFHISANRFLRNMVRAIVGTLINVGLKKVSLEDFENIIQSKNRGKAGFSVPAHGLYLTEVKYPFEFVSS